MPKNRLISGTDRMYQNGGSMSLLAAEAIALLALMLLYDSRRDACFDEAGDLVVLGEQDRRRGDQRQIAEALPLVEEALRGGPGPFALHAAIAALHCQAGWAEDTDWPQIMRLCDVLERLQTRADLRRWILSGGGEKLPLCDWRH